MTKCALQTWLGTLVYFDPRGRRLRHGLPESASEIVYLDTVTGRPGGRLLTTTALESALPPALGSDIHVEAHETVDTVSLKTEGWVSAENDGRISTNRPAIGAWEIFTLITAEAAKRMVGNDRDPHTEVPVQPRQTVIPRAIHQIYLANATPVRLQPYMSRNIETLKARNTNYSYTLWTNKEVHDAIYDWYGYDILSRYLRINPRYGAARADLFRYLLMYAQGGVYLDMKSNTDRHLDEIFTPTDGYILSFWSQKLQEQKIGWHPALEAHGHHEFLQWFLICEPGHPYLAAVIDEVLRKIDTYDPHVAGRGRPGVLNTTGPIPYTLAIMRVLDKYRHILVDAEKSGLIYNNTLAIGNLDARHYSELEDDVVL